MITIQHDGDTWRILSEGATRGGKTFCHLASTTRFRQQRNGQSPVQVCDWIDHATILAGAQRGEEAQRALHRHRLRRRHGPARPTAADNPRLPAVWAALKGLK